MKFIYSFLNKIKHQRLLFAALLLLGIYSFLLNKNNPPAPATSCNCGTLIDIEFSDKVPGDNKLVTGQTQADCFAWAEFVALNWPVNAKDKFGEPGNTGLVQWETYMSREMLMTPDGSPPPPWGSQIEAADHLAKFQTGKKAGTKLLMHQSKFNGDSQITLDETGQAAPGNAPNWLGAQNGTNLWYEVLINEDEYNYITKNSFYNADSQYAYVVTRGDTIDLPEGSATQVGAIELKAAWMEVLDPKNKKWDRYKLSKAILIDPISQEPKAATVALIGLHILHKTESQPTWFWATFEHVDNVPGDGKQMASYNLYNSNCEQQQVKVPANCAPNKSTSEQTYTIGCTPNQSPPYYLCSGAAPVPIQVTRRIPIDEDAQAVNKLLQTYVAENFPGSVWANYQLINMIWSTTPQNEQSNRTPQGLKSMQPHIPMANSSMETYAQQLTCFNCHQFASIANTLNSQNGAYASDFSFVLGFANYPGKK